MNEYKKARMIVVLIVVTILIILSFAGFTYAR